MTRITFVLLSLLIINCTQKERQLENNDHKLLNLYVLERIVEQKANDPKMDSIVLGLSNSNSLIFSNYKEYLELKKDSFIKMPKSVSKVVNGKTIFVDVVKGDSTYNSLLKKPFVTIEVDSIVREFYSENEYSNYEKQVSNGKWDSIIFDKFKYIHPSNANANANANRILYVSKPMYTLNKRYALIYGVYKKSGMYPSIEIYENINDKWSKIHTINSW